MLALGKGLSSGYLPLAITLVSEKIFSAFDGSVASGKALAYGHSYTGNALGCAAAKASLEVFRQEDVLETLQPKIRHLKSALAELETLSGVLEIRRCGFIVGIQLDESNEGGLPGLPQRSVSTLGDTDSSQGRSGMLLC
jgi:adenosylmethionine---8-amino-7-oxononanoate aminotransferase